MSSAAVAVAYVLGIFLYLGIGLGVTMAGARKALDKGDWTGEGVILCMVIWPIIAVAALVESVLEKAQGIAARSGETACGLDRRQEPDGEADAPEEINP